MTHWTYTLTGRPDTPDVTVTEQEEPGPVIIAERPDDSMTCDLWLLANRVDMAGQATYGWNYSGTPEDVILHLADGLGIPRQEVRG